MRRNIQRLGLVGLTILTLSLWSGKAHAFGGRYFSGGHPYHNGFLFVPPSSAYEAVGYRPPIRYGAPAYYFPASYLSPASGVFPPPMYPGVPAWRAGGYYMSTYGAGVWYPW